MDVAPPRYVIGIDPGLHGGLASYAWTDDAHWEVEKLAQSPHDRLAQLERHVDAALSLRSPLTAILEDVPSFAGVARPGNSMFVFGKNTGQTEGILIALKYQIIRVRPQRWQSELGIKSRKDESRADHKKRLRQLAMDLFPDLRPSLDVADALLIAWWYIHEKYLLTKSE